MTIAVTNGCFDPLTGSHVAFLSEAAKHGDLIVLLARDSAVRRLRGPARPLLPFEHRKATLLALRSVQNVIGYDTEDELADAYKQLRPAALVKGAEWAGKSLTGERYCRKVVYLPEIPGHASDFLTAYLARSFERHPSPDVQVIPKVWGEEWVFAHTSQYTGKLLRVVPGKQSSLHRHYRKDETFLIITGEVLVQTQYSPHLPCSRGCAPEVGHMLCDAGVFRSVPSTRVYRAGDTVRVKPMTWHRFANRSNLIVEFVEAGTHHDDADVERKEPSGDLRPEVWR